MKDSATTPMDFKITIVHARDMVASVGIGWIAAMGVVSFVPARLPEHFDQTEGLLSFLEPTVWFSVAALVYAVIQHFHARHTRNTPDFPPTDNTAIRDRQGK